MPKPFDTVALAQAINRRREEFNRRHPDHPVIVSPTMSRILESDPEYKPRRTRKTMRRRSAAVNPSVSAVVAIADALDTTVGDLLGERAFRITRADRERIREFVRYLSALFELDRLGE